MMHLSQFEFVQDPEASPPNKRRNSNTDKSSGMKKAKTAKNQSESDEEWDLESSDESVDDEDDASLVDSDSESDASDYCSARRGNNKGGKRLQKGKNDNSKKRKKVYDSDDDKGTSTIAKAPTTAAKRPPKPVTAAFLNKPAASLSENYSQYSAYSQSSPSSSTPTSHSTPSTGQQNFAPHITPSPRNGQNDFKSSPPTVPVNRIPLPEGVSGLGSHDHNSWSWLKLENRKDKEGRKMDHPEYDPRTIYIPEKVIKEQTPAMKQWFEIKRDYFDTVLFFKVYPQGGQYVYWYIILTSFFAYSAEGGQVL